MTEKSAAEFEQYQIIRHQNEKEQNLKELEADIKNLKK